MLLVGFNVEKRFSVQAIVETTSSLLLMPMKVIAHWSQYTEHFLESDNYEKI